VHAANNDYELAETRLMQGSVAENVRQNLGEEFVELPTTAHVEIAKPEPAKRHFA
jgi:hypothetical protein